MMGVFACSAVVVMDASEGVSEIETTIQRSVISLSQIVREFFPKGIELTRICRVAVLLKKSGVNPNTILYHKLAKKCIDGQRDDGGWTDVIETMWCTSFLSFFEEFSGAVEKALQWLRRQRHNSGGWGKSTRDPARIPVTGLLLYLLPQLSSDEDLRWMENEWCEERKFEPHLTYKAAFTLMAFNQNDYHPQNQDLILKTVRWLSDQQNDDGGWGPWKGHPVGSDPWCTGIDVAGLLQYPDRVPQKVLCRALKWLQEKQLPNGLWPFHYIEEGSSWALCALIMGYSSINGR